MMMTQWYDILELIGAVFAGFSAMLVLVVYLEQWLAQPDLSSPAPADEEALNESDRRGIEHWTPDLSVEAGASYLPRAAAPDLSFDRPVARVTGRRFSVLPRGTRWQRTLNRR